MKAKISIIIAIALASGIEDSVLPIPDWIGKQCKKITGRKREKGMPIV